MWDIHHKNHISNSAHCPINIQSWRILLEKLDISGMINFNDEEKYGSKTVLSIAKDYLARYPSSDEVPIRDCSFLSPSTCI